MPPSMAVRAKAFYALTHPLSTRSDIACSVLGLLNDVTDAEVIGEDESGRAENVIEVLVCKWPV